MSKDKNKNTVMAPGADAIAGIALFRRRKEVSGGQAEMIVPVPLFMSVTIVSSVRVWSGASGYRADAICMTVP